MNKPSVSSKLKNVKSEVKSSWIGLVEGQTTEEKLVSWKIYKINIQSEAQNRNVGKDRKSSVI